jgi:hypothetical protein
MSQNTQARETRRIDRAVERTTAKVSRALDDMVLALPEAAAPQMAIELVVRELAQMQPWFMRLIMEDPDIRETYAAATAERPATASAARGRGRS